MKQDTGAQTFHVYILPLRL